MLQARDQYLNSQSKQLILAIPEAAFGRRFVMPELHGFQISEIVAVSSPDVVIAGALTGIGRAAARIFAQEGVHGVTSGWTLIACPHFRRPPSRP
jgi:hypothetical protein